MRCIFSDFWRCNSSDRGELPLRFSCVIACEVINHPANVLRTEDAKPGEKDEVTYFVVPDETHVRARLLLLYDDSVPSGAGAPRYVLWLLALLAAAIAVLAPMLFD